MSAGPGVSSDRLRLAILGFGRVGRAVLELALTRPWLEVTCVTTRSADREGEPARRTVAAAPEGLRIQTDQTAALREARPDVVCIATVSRLRDVLPHLEAAASSGARAIVCTAEELAYAQPEDGPEAAAIHGLSARHAVPIVATGGNPGFVLDLWPRVLAGLAWDVQRIESRRVVDVSVFAPHTRAQLGIGHQPEAFAAGVADGSIAGHLGFRESLRLLSESMGYPTERITIETSPVLADREHRLADGSIAAGSSMGVTQRAVAWHAGRAWITVEMLLHAAPEEVGVRPIDEVHVFGRHELHATIDPGSAAILGTAAQLINIIPVALGADPGLYGPGQLRPGAPWLAATPPPMSPRPVAVIA